MSSPATVTEKSNKAQPDHTLLIIPDGSPLWLTPDPDDDNKKMQRMRFGWSIDGITALMDQLPASNIPVLIGAMHRTSHELCVGSAHAWKAWGNAVGVAQQVRVTHRYPGTEMYASPAFGSDDPIVDAEIWLVANETFHNGTTCVNSVGWSSSLRRLGFDVRSWNSSKSLDENLAPVNGEGKSLPPRVRNPLPDPTRPTSITVGTFEDLRLVTTMYPLGD